MDVTTGNIKELKDITPDEMEKGNWVRLGKRPNPGCKHCHGRGHLGRNVTTNEFIICSCVKRRP